MAHGPTKSRSVRVPCVPLQIGAKDVSGLPKRGARTGRHCSAVKTRQVGSNSCDPVDIKCLPIGRLITTWATGCGATMARAKSCEFVFGRVRIVPLIGWLRERCHAATALQVARSMGISRSNLGRWARPVCTPRGKRYGRPCGRGVSPNYLHKLHRECAVVDYPGPDGALWFTNYGWQFDRSDHDRRDDNQLHRRGR